MLKQIKYFCIALLFVPFMACEDDEVFSGEPTFDSLEVLKSHQWGVLKANGEHDGLIIDLEANDNGIFSICAQDNFYKFQADGTIENLENSDVCLDAPQIKAYIDGEWWYNQVTDSLEIATLSLDTIAGTINAVSETEIDLNIEYDEDWNGKPYRLLLTLYSVD